MPIIVWAELMVLEMNLTTAPMIAAQTVLMFSSSVPLMLYLNSIFDFRTNTD